jgi:CRP/FNR family cyclic AMP-dependent transcriptional regulator
MPDQENGETFPPHQVNNVSDSGGVNNRTKMKPINIFCDLSDTQIRNIYHRMHTSTINSGTIIYRPNENADELFFLKSGAVEIYNTSRDGKRYVLSTVSQGTFFGEMSIVGQSKNTAYAAAVERSTVSTMNRYGIEDVVAKYSLVGLRIMQALAYRLNEAEAQLETLALKSLTARLASLVLDLTPRQTSLIVGLTHKDLAERVGTSRETATQMLNELKADGLIQIGRKRILVLDRKGLQGIADFY